MSRNSTKTSMSLAELHDTGALGYGDVDKKRKCRLCGRLLEGSDYDITLYFVLIHYTSILAPFHYFTIVQWHYSVLQPAFR